MSVRNYDVNSRSASSGGDTWFAEHELYVGHWAKYMHVLVRTNVKITAIGSVQQSPAPRYAQVDSVTVTLSHTRLDWGGSQTQGPGVCLLTALWGCLGSTGNFPDSSGLLSAAKTRAPHES